MIGWTTCLSTYLPAFLLALCQLRVQHNITQNQAGRCTLITFVSDFKLVRGVLLLFLFTYWQLLHMRVLGQRERAALFAFS